MRATLQPSLDPAAYDFAHDVRVRFAETDAMGIVHHAAYLPYLEEARIAFLRASGRPYSTLRDEDVDIAVLEVVVTYRRPLRFDEVVSVHLRPAEATPATFQIAYLLTVDGEPRATAVTALACIGPSGGPVRVPAWLRALAGHP